MTLTLVFISRKSIAVIKINEIFYSIQGETTLAGLPTVFVRTTACNLRCSYCDTKYSYYVGSNQSIEEILSTVRSYPTKYVCITGGEPLLQKPVHTLMTSLCDLGYTVSLETSGSKSIAQVDPRVKIILDVKTPDSGAANSFFMENLRWVNPSTEFKFVICSEKDFDWSEEFCSQHDLFEKFTILYSPSFETMKESELAKLLLDKKSQARLQLQLHKYIWSPELRGV